MSGWAADWNSGSSYNYPGASGPAADVYGRYQQGAGGSYRPTDGASAPWHAPTGTGAGATWSSSAWAEGGGASAWNDQPQGYRGDSRAGQSERPLADYRFRQRPEDKAKMPDDALRYRPDPELARRSQQFWGVPGQDPSSFGGGPGVVFRPLRPEQEQSSRPKTGQYRGEPAQPPQAGYPGTPSYSYGYPY